MSDSSGLSPTQLEKPGAHPLRRNWWAWAWEVDGGPSSRAFQFLTVIVAVGALAVSLTTRSSNSTVETSNASYSYTYMSESGAPGDPDPQSKSCGDAESGVIGGWGPDRPTFTLSHPAPYTSLNAIRDNPDYGDERGFFRIKDAGDAAGGGWDYQVSVERDHTYLLQAYVENSAVDDNELVAVATTFSVNLPTCTGRRIASNAFLSSSNAFPQQIWGGVTFEGDEDFNLAYVGGSAKLYSNYWPNPGLTVDETFLTSKGILLGANKMDGNVLPGYKHSIYISFEVRPQFAPN